MIEAPRLQRFVSIGGRILPRGWSRILKQASRIAPSLRNYRARTNDGDVITLDLSHSMCLPYLMYGELPHDRGIQHTINRVLRPGDTFVDVGANIGYYTRMGSRIVGSGGRVLAFEPSPAAYKLLVRNTETLQNVELVRAAVSNNFEDVEFGIRAKGDMSSMDTRDALETIRVPSVTLDGILAQHPAVRLIKIDVEGFERAVLEGAQQCLLNQRPVVCFEFTERFASLSGVTAQDFAALFESAKYGIRWLHPSGKTTPVFGEPSNNIIALPEEFGEKHLFVSE